MAGVEAITRPQSLLSGAIAALVLMSLICTCKAAQPPRIQEEHFQPTNAQIGTLERQLPIQDFVSAFGRYYDGEIVQGHRRIVGLLIDPTAWPLLGASKGIHIGRIPFAVSDGSPCSAIYVTFDVDANSIVHAFCTRNFGSRSVLAKQILVRPKVGPRSRDAPKLEFTPSP